MSSVSASTLADLPPDVLAQALRTHGLDDWADVTWAAATGSTNTDVLAALRTGGNGPRLLGTHHQHQGRGRVERPFATAPGSALIVSCGFLTDLPLAELPVLSVAFGVVACETLGQALPPGHNLRLKWPNDLQLGDAKLAGILTETTQTPSGRTGVVVGMGVNLTNGAALSEHLGRAVADWSQTGTPLPMVASIVALAKAWQTALQALTNAPAPRRWPNLAQRFAAVDALRGREIQLIDQGTVLTQGRADGVEPDGRLRVQTATGLLPVMVGDVSVRPAGSA